MRIEIDEPTRPDIRALLDLHVSEARANSPPGGSFALDHSALRQPGITFWSARDDAGTLMGCGALKRLCGRFAEVKSMHTQTRLRGRGTGRAILDVILTEARRTGLARLYLETGNNDAYLPARKLYARAGFVECGPFADYRDNGFSVFMRLDLTANGDSQIS